MVTISKALQAAQVIDYHKKDYTNAQSNYYSQGDQIPGQWHGKLAQELGLQGAVSLEQFTRLALGQHPHTGEQLVRHRIATGNSAEHRAGWDATFSPPKSGSIAALIGGDKAIIEAHRLAVQEAIDYLERYANAHIGGNHPDVPTGKWAAATFEHDSARPIAGFAAPQLHTHVVFFNLAQTEDGNFHALQEHPIFKQQNFATTIYQARYARELYRLGYDLEEGKNHSSEIKGYTPEYLEANSGRSAIIQEGMKELEKKGIHGAEARQILAHSTRESKTAVYSPEVMRQLHQDLAAQHGNQHLAVLKAALANRLARLKKLTPEAARTAARQAVNYAIDRGFEREGVVTSTILQRDAMRRGTGIASFGEIESAFKAKIQSGELILAGHKHGLAYTTPAMVAMERENIQRVIQGQVKHPPIVAREQIREDKLSYLRAQQHTAAIQILTSCDQVLGLQGAAGTGKTTTLRVIREELEHHGYRVRGYAPTSRAARNLADAGIETTTIQYRLVHGPDTTPAPTIHFLDESSLASTKQINEFLNTLPAHDRAVLVGDARQHESVDAGRVFAQLQENGMHTAFINQIQRQKDPQLKQIVQLLSEGRSAEAFHDMKTLGHITQIADPTERYQAITKDYLNDPENTLVLTTDNRSRTQLNDTIHSALRDSGQLAGPDREIPILVTRQLQEADKRFAEFYKPTNTIRFSNRSKKYGIAAREYVTVTASNAQDNTVTIVKQDGRSITYSPKYNHGVTVYENSKAHLAVGERIQFTQPFKDHKIANRDLGIITSVGTDKDPSLTVKLDSGQLVTFDPEQFRHIDYGYTVTSYSAQSLTTRNTVSNLNTAVNAHLINERMGYVVESRGTHTAKVYTDDVEKLEKYFSQDISKTSALDGINALSWTSTPATPAQGHAPQLSQQAPAIPSTVHPPARTPAIKRSAIPSQRRGQAPPHDISAPRHAPPPPNVVAPAAITATQEKFRHTLPPQHVDTFSHMSHEDREIYMHHHAAYKRMAPLEAAAFANSTLAERSAYIEQHPALTQPIPEAPNRSVGPEIDNSNGISF